MWIFFVKTLHVYTSRNGAQLEEGAETRVSVLGDVSLITVSTLTFQVTGDMAGHLLTCQAVQEETGDTQTVSTTISLQAR